jgi:amino acid transporter
MATLDLPTTAATIESSKLQRHFGRLDILFFLICTIVGVDTVANVAQGGGQAFTWMMILALVFFIPQALLFSEQGTAFPMEGGPYYWTRLAFGHLAGAVTNFLYWITNPVWIGGSLTISCIGAVQVFFNNGARGSWARTGRWPCPATTAPGRGSSGSSAPGSAPRCGSTCSAGSWRRS